MVNIRLATSALALTGVSVLLISKHGSANENLNRFLGAEEVESTTTSVHRQLGFFDPKSVQEKRKLDDDLQGMLAVVISTPKCGTGSLTSTFSRSLKCHPSDDISIGEVVLSECENDNTVIRSHSLTEATAVLSKHREQKPDQRCVVVTGIRDPQPWLPSMFMQSKESKEICDADISREDFFKKYHDWIMDHGSRINHAVKEVRPGLLQAFNSKGLTHEVEQMNRNGGYSFLNGADPNGPFAGCDMLFFRMEDSKRWPDIISNLLPGITYETNKSRVDRCPKIADHYKALSKEYKLSDEEKMHLVHGDPQVAEYFQVYGHKGLGTNVDSTPNTSNNEGTLALVINTPKCGTGGLSKTLQVSYGCKRKETMQIGNSELNNCENRNHVVRTHDLQEGTQILKGLREEYASGQPQRCVIVTAIRDPRTWIPSLFMQTPQGQAFCDADVTRSQYLQAYHDWLMVNGGRIQSAVANVRPKLLAEFGAESLASEMSRVDQNGGYSILNQPDPQGVYADCQLLFLQMERSENWATIMAEVMPGVEYKKNKSRTESCPKIADHYVALYQYSYSQEELALMTDGGRNIDVVEYFSVYGL
mmetsp:Transcript_5933/g.9151  ORF Transcript_5933/g.9151 Transcript_5933/m.9151 type:complete len:590 (-) Transcript_5933:116-1885(-)